MTFRAGQKVICIDADGAYMLTLNGVYTVNKVSYSRLQRWRGVVSDGQALWLYEAKPEVGYIGFAAERFRPLVDRPTDISIFTSCRERHLGHFTFPHRQDRGRP